MVVNWPLATLQLMGEAWEAGEEADLSFVEVQTPDPEWLWELGPVPQFHHLQNGVKVLLPRRTQPTSVPPCLAHRGCWEGPLLLLSGLHHDL